MLEIELVNEKTGVSKKTLEDWQLKCYDIQISFPSAKTYLVDIPGGDGKIDLTEALTGEVKFNNRTISLSFDYRGDYFDWKRKISEIANFLHGKRTKIFISTDKYYYYVGRVMIDTKKSNIADCQIELTGEVEPYKLEVVSSTDKWLWDSFDLKTGVIREYKDIVVSGDTKVEVIGSPEKVIPIFECTNSMYVTFNNQKTLLPKGRSKNLDIEIIDGVNEMIFSGNGKVTIEFRGGSL